ncbi:MAG: helix-hairpin-helix domain-containing protein [Lachnospiraceae bacterium]|nr:helix-hairpin-helix domain-containing protein [Lachnospiraceae bacterium]
MNQEEKIARIKELTPLLSVAARVYEQEDREIMSNFEYDKLYDELKALEEETGIVLSESPTHKVGYEVLSELPKEKHESPMLSLNKTKSREELADWLGSQKGVLSWKMDGLTVVVTYRNGELFKAVTRGNGEVGEVITNNVRVFKNIPQSIPFKGELVIRGEAIIRYSDFEKINEAIADADAKYKNPRNLCSGSVRQLDNSITAQRSVYLYAFALISQTGDDAPAFDYRSEQLDYLESLGFNVVERKKVSASDISDSVSYFADKITSNDFPSDGLVLLYDDIAYGNSLGRTAKFPRDGIAFKWADETAVTTLREIEWSASRTGLINPVAIFDPVELEGTTVSRASLHNISIMKDLMLGIGDSISVYKANMIIPQLAENLTRSAEYSICDAANEDTIKIADTDKALLITDKRNGCSISKQTVSSLCPVCSCPTCIHLENDVMTLYCVNPDCDAKKIKLFAHLVSRDALNIEGLSESTVEKLINAGLLHKQSDIFRLEEKKERFIELEGLGEKSFNNLIDSINKARNTVLSRVIYGLGIANIGLANARLICKYAGDDPEAAIALTSDELTAIEGIGDVLAASYTEYFLNNSNLDNFRTLLSELSLEKEAAAGDALSGKVFVITGSVEHFANRNELKAYIESQGGKVTGSVTNKTSFLINNDITSNSSKNKTAKQLGIEIITEDDFISRFGS